MTPQGSTTELTKGTGEKALDQLNRIVSSKAFRQAGRLKRFLSFVVEETVSGRKDRLKEFAVGVEVFGKDSSFDPRNDPIVRVQARRLRAQLTRYYQEEGQEDELVIEMPKGGYAPFFRILKSAAPKRPVTPTVVRRNTIRVLPFADHSPEGNQKYFCDGLLAEIIHSLAGMEGVRLLAWGPAAAAGNQDVSAYDQRRVAGFRVPGESECDYPGESNAELREGPHRGPGPLHGCRGRDPGGVMSRAWRRRKASLGPTEKRPSHPRETRAGMDACPGTDTA
jgi:hypothetical protein